MIEQILSFFSYFAAACVLLALFVLLYVHITPYREFALIRSGNLSACLALLGAVAGFSLPDMLLWALLAMAAQALVYLLIDRILPDIPRGIGEGVPAHGALLGGLSVCVGLINAACITY
ncbi:MAG: DUF350 domain-containing protein [Xanthomonadales bacterium]|nr:DUF350 domain-containing protein [Xanthomonadales bacterium]